MKRMQKLKKIAIQFTAVANLSPRIQQSRPTKQFVRSSIACRMVTSINMLRLLLCFGFGEVEQLGCCTQAVLQCVAQAYSFSANAISVHAVFANQCPIIHANSFVDTCIIAQLWSCATTLRNFLNQTLAHRYRCEPFALLGWRTYYTELAILLVLGPEHRSLVVAQWTTDCCLEVLLCFVSGCCQCHYILLLRCW